LEGGLVDDCWTYTSREMELNVKFNQKADRYIHRWTDWWTGQ